MKAVEIEPENIITKVGEEMLLGLLGMLDLFPRIAHREGMSIGQDCSKWHSKLAEQAADELNGHMHEFLASPMWRLIYLAPFSTTRFTVHCASLASCLEAGHLAVLYHTDVTVRVLFVQCLVGAKKQGFPRQLDTIRAWRRLSCR